jgi:hypothetical protein
MPAITPVPSPAEGSSADDGGPGGARQPAVGGAPCGAGQVLSASRG